MQLTALYTSDGEMIVHRSGCRHQLPPGDGGYPDVREKLYFSAGSRLEAMERSWPRSLATTAREKLHPERWAGRTRFQPCAEGLPAARALHWTATGAREWHDTNGRGYRLTQNAVTGNVFIYKDGILLNARYRLSAAKKYAQDHENSRAGE